MIQNMTGFSCNQCKLVRPGFHNTRTMCICGNGQRDKFSKGFSRVTIVYDNGECGSCETIGSDRDRWKSIANEYMVELVKLKETIEK